MWETNCDEAFKKLLKMLKDLPSIRPPDFTRPFKLSTDASDTAVGACHSQNFNGFDNPIAFASQTLNSAQSKYSIIDKECWAIVWATRKFRHYLYGHPFILETDHNPLTYLKSSRDLRGCRTGWALELKEYQYDIRHVPGKQNVMADALSRSLETLDMTDKFDLPKHQKIDIELKKIIEEKENNRGKSFKKYNMQNEILCYSGRKGNRPVAPINLRKDLFEKVHSKILSYFGVDKTLDYLSSRYYWSEYEG